MSAPNLGRVAVVRSVVDTVRDHDVTFLAAGISSYGLVSLLPLFTLAIVLATALGGAEFAARVQSIAGAYLLPTGSELVTDALENRAGQGALSAVTLTVTLWGALKLFRGVDVAFARLYGYPVSPILRQLSDGIVALATLGAAVVGVAVATAVVAVVDLPFVGVVGPLVLVTFLILAFLPLYAVIPDVSVPLRAALPGAVLAGRLGVGAADPAPNDGRARDRDRQVQQPRGRHSDRTMSADDAADDAFDHAGSVDDPPDGAETEIDPRGAPDIEQLDRRVEALRDDLDSFEDDIEARTVDRPTLKADLERYVRGRLRRGKARGWGPYLVLLYGTAATISAFYLLDDDLLAVVAMVIIYLSTLGLYTLFVVFGVGLNALGVPGRFVDWIRDRRS